MSSRLEEKLGAALERCRTYIDEALVVYVLVQVRKLLESSHEKYTFKNLKFHCDWALHVRLHLKSAQDYLANIDRLIEEIGPAGVEKSTMSEAESLARFDQFMQELGELLKFHSLPTDITDDPETGLKFLNAYIASIEGAGLEGTADGLKHVKSFRVMSIPDETLHDKNVSLPVTFLILAPDNKPIYRWHFTFSITKTD